MPAAPKEQYLTIECGWCGKTHSATIGHYDIVRASCGRYFWALQPNRGGPLKLFPNPRLNALIDQRPPAPSHDQA